MKKIFRPSLEGARQVLENQLDLAEDQDRLVQKVILTGGFGQSPSLQNHLRAYLAKRASQKGRSPALIIPKNPSVFLPS
jgi:actin-related protein